MMRIALLACIFSLVAFPAFAAPPDPTIWRQLDPENTLYIETSKGLVVVEMYPEIAPGHVQRIKELARENFYNGLIFHRVIENFMAQTDAPKGTGEGGSAKPDIAGEFLFRRGADMPFVEAAVQGGGRLGFYKALPIATQPDEMMALTRDGKAAAWGLHCPGIASMARTGDPNSANSQFFLMRGSYPSLDKRYTIWGRVVWNEEAVKSIAVGEPPVAPDIVKSIKVAADALPEDRAPIYVMRSDSTPFRELLDDVRKSKRADFSVCDVQVPVRVPRDEPQKGRKWWRVIPLIP